MVYGHEAYAALEDGRCPYCDAWSEGNTFTGEDGRNGGLLYCEFCQVQFAWIDCPFECEAQELLCAVCSGPAVHDRNDPPFGLCGHCENRMNSRESKNKIPSLRGNSEGIGKEVPLSHAVDPERKTFVTSGQTQLDLLGESFFLYHKLSINQLIFLYNF